MEDGGVNYAPAHDAPDEDDEEDYEDQGRESRLLGFMFGNVDHYGDLDADYLDEITQSFTNKLDPVELNGSHKAIVLGRTIDSEEPTVAFLVHCEDAKEHLSALVDKLDSSLTGIDITKSPTATDALEQDYGTKAENAIDYEDIEEQYEGPEVQSVPEESSILADDYLARNISMSSIIHKQPLFDEENYDEDDDGEKENESAEAKLEAQAFLPTDENNLTPIPKIEEPLVDTISEFRSPEDDQTTFDGDEFEEESAGSEELKDSEGRTSLPILYVDEGTVVLRFSEIFGIHEPAKRMKRRDKPRIKTMDVVSIEDDEELFLHSSLNIGFSGRVPSSLQKTYRQIQEDECGSMVKDRTIDSCLSSQPMKEDVQISAPSEWNSRILHELYPLHQLEWEEQIVWGNSSPSPESQGFLINSESNRYISNVGSVDLLGLGDICEKDRNHNLLIQSSNPRSDNNEPTETENSKGIDDILVTDTSRSFRKLTLQNKEFLEGNWLDQIVWDSFDNLTKPKLIYDLQDEQMLFEVLDQKDVGDLRSHAGAMIMNHFSKSPLGYLVDSSSQGAASIARFNISNDKYYSNRKTGQQSKTHAKKRVIHGLKVMHSVPALKLQTMKPKLSNKEMANFHRPKALWFPHENEFISKLEGPPDSKGSILIIVKSLGGKSLKFFVAADETISSFKWKLAKKLDVRSPEKVKLLYMGRELEDDMSLASQNVRPNSLLHLVRTKIHLLPRAQKLPGENKPLRPPGAFKKKSDLSVKDGHLFLMEYCEERPLLLSNIGMGARLCTYYLKSTPGDQMAASLQSTNSDLGNVLALDPADKSPFLGDIKPGCYQSSLETNMYRAPLFPHKLSTTDYLLVRSAKGTLSLRRIDKLYVVGQQEPHMEAMSPGTKNVPNYIWNRLLVHVYREFRVKEKPGFRPRIRADDLYSLFPSLTEAVVRKRLKHCADLKRGRNGVLFWEMKSDFHLPLEEELRRMLTPENVCCYESMQAGLYRLKQLGIGRLTHPIGLSSAMNQLPDEAIALAAASHIERELLITSWNLSSNFVACTSQDKENIERLELTGVGDPSGRGLGFSYVRVTPKAPITSAVVKKKASAGRGSSTVTGTDADLRRLSMDAAREVLLKFNVPEEQIEKLTRWHRIALVRRLSSEQAISGVTVDAPALCKFARGQRMSFLQLQQQTREKCQEIWDRQSQSLTASVYDGNESDSGANSDLDSFAGDLENLLDAEEFEEGEEGYLDSKSDKADVVKGLKMRRCPSQAQKKEEIEDDEAEAVTILRLFEEDEIELKKKKIKPAAARVITHLVPETDDISKKNTFAKRIVTALPQPTFSFTSKEINVREPKEAIIKERRTVERPVREGFVCGACGQVGHMRTNKNCPKYGEELDLPDVEATTLKSHLSEGVTQLIPKMPIKKLPKAEAQEASEKPSIKLPVKILPLKFKYGPETLQEKISPGPQSLEMETEPAKKIKKIIISNKSKPQDQLQELQRPTVVIKMASESERDQPPPKKIIFKQTKSMSNLESFGTAPETGVDEGFRKIKKIAELAGPQTRDKQPAHWEGGERKRKERVAAEWRMQDQQTLIDVYRHDDPEWGINDRESKKENMYNNKKKKKKKKPEMKEKYSGEFRASRSERPERDRAAKRHSVVEFGRDSDGYTPPTKRRRGGEVLLCNILENIVDTLRNHSEVSYLFLKPVSRKDAPDYLDIVKRPMDLSTIKEKVKKMEYRGREDFRHDVWQITFNAHRYNDGKNPGIPPLADQLLELCDYLIDQNEEGLTEAESGIEV